MTLARRQQRAPRRPDHRTHQDWLAARRTNCDPGTRRQQGNAARRRHSAVPNVSPYSLNEAVSDLTTNIAATDTDRAQPVTGHAGGDTRPDCSAAGPDVRRLVPAVQVTQQPQRHTRELLKNAGTVTQVLSERSQQVNTLILNANDLLAVLVERRDAISGLLANTAAVARTQRTGRRQREGTRTGAGTLEHGRPRCWRRTATTCRKPCRGSRSLNSAAANRLERGLLQRARPQSPSAPVVTAVPRLRVRVPAPAIADQPRALFPWPRNGIPGGSR